MTSAPIRAVVVDDSAFMRIAIRQMLEADGITVVGEGRDGEEAIDLARRIRPDIMTLDIIMPGMDGMAALKTIAEDQLCPVIMVSTETRDGARATIRALDLGAVDIVAKGSDLADLDMAWIQQELAAKVRHWARQEAPARRKPPQPKKKTEAPTRSASPQPPDLVVVAASTGGPRALTELVTGLETGGPPIVIAQHMPSGFTQDFAAHLATRSGREVVEAESGMILHDGAIVVLPGGTDSKIVTDASGALAVMRAATAEQPVHPWADLVLKTALASANCPVAVILTGMGQDGAEGARAFADQGHAVLVQSPETCVVDGMPRAAIDNGAASDVLTIGGIVRRLSALSTAQEKAVSP